MAMTENDKIAKYGPVVQLVGSHTSDDVYHVRKKDGIHQCDCKGFVFSKEVPKSCKHIKAFLAQAHLTQPKAEVSELQITEKCLKTAGCYEPIERSCESKQAFQHKLARLAQALLPYLGGKGPIEEETRSDIIRMIYID